MKDVLDEIIDALPPSTVRLILNFNRDRVNRNLILKNLLHETQEIKLKQMKSEFERKTYDLKSKTAENRNYLLKLKNELKVLNSLKEPDDNQKCLKAYTMKIDELKERIKHLTQEHGDVDLTQLFNDVEDLNQQIEEHKKKITEAKNIYRSYNNFPPSVEKAKEEIAKVKERIKQYQLAKPLK